METVVSRPGWGRAAGRARGATAGGHRIAPARARRVARGIRSGTADAEYVEAIRGVARTSRAAGRLVAEDAAAFREEDLEALSGRDGHGWVMLPCDALVVDDDIDGRDALAQVLEAHGYAVRKAENGRIALDMIAERVPCIMLLDLDMPVMSGWELLASLQRASVLHAITVVVLSAGASPPPGFAFMPKPYGVDDLLAMIRRSSAAGASSPGGHP